MELTTREDIWDGERWHFILTRIRPPERERFQHFCKDDGGHLFQFFWHEIDDLPGPFEQPFDKVMTAARDALNLPK